ncbi:MAG: FtsX-like permease family protein [Acidimicrobiales bacterium]
MSPVLGLGPSGSMTATLVVRGTKRPPDGGASARRAVIRWAWRLFRGEWRQQLLILALISVAVAATIVGSAVATDDAQPATFGFGTAQDSATFTSYDAHSAGIIAGLQHRFGRVEMIENRIEPIPGSISTFDLRSEDPRGPFSSPMLSLVTGHYPSGADEVAVTEGVASAFHLEIGQRWAMGGVDRQVVGIVENPESLLDEFALVPGGQVSDPTSVTALFDAPGAPLSSFPKGAQVTTPASVEQSNPLNPETISLAALVLGMLLIALVSVGGFTVLAQRRLRAIGMLEATGATDDHVRLVVRANGTVVGLLGAILGFVVGLATWLAYRPALEQSSHHVIGVFALSWPVVIAAMVLAVIAAYFAASRPARAITKVPVVQALSGRPAPPRQLHRSALPGIVCVVLAFLALGYSGANSGDGNGGMLELVVGIVLLVPGLILLSPFLVSVAARLARHTPISARLALGDLARYRARSGPALAAISVGVLVAVIVMLAAAARYGNAFDYAGPNLASNEHELHANQPPLGRPLVARSPSGNLIVVHQPSTPTSSPTQLATNARQIANGAGGRLVALEVPDASLEGSHLGRQWDGAIYVATPGLLRTFGVKSSQIDPNADVLTSRPGLAGTSGLVLDYGSGAKQDAGPAAPREGSVLAHPVIEELGALPLGTSAPNTVITEHAVAELHLQVTTNDWLIQGTQPFSPDQIAAAQRSASTAQLDLEAKNDQPSSDAVLTWATIFGLVIALGVLGMSVGLVRAEASSDLSTLAATGATGHTRRMLTAVTAGSLGFLGALLGTLGGYIGLIGWLRSNSLNGGIASLGNVPLGDLAIILFAMPAFAAVVGWLLAGREPAAIGHQPIG